jgi:RNA polymerase sigma-54 factor
MANQSLSLLQSQRQIQMLAPQLRQSLELLQLPALELRAAIQKELQQNPTLEEKPPETADIAIEPAAGAVDDAGEMSFKEEFDVLSRMDDEWCEYFMQEQEYRVPDPDYHKKQEFLINSAGESLQEHLRRQLAVSGLDEYDRRIGELLIGSLNDDGFLAQSLEALAESTGADLTRLQDVLNLVQDFSPVGIGARDLQECLLLQLERLGHADSLAATIVTNHLEMLGRREHKEIARLLDQPLAAVHEAARLIATLDPRPGRAFSPEVTQYIIPEITVEKVNDQYVVILNDDHLPHLRISRHYRELMKQSDTQADVRDYIRDRIRSGVLLIKSIAQRRQTIYRVATEIVRVQRDFLDHGITHLRPLVMADVARKVKLHETTISRCVANKYMQTPQGVFEMKYFFTPGLKTAGGETVSNKTVQDMIKNIVIREDPAQPLSDQEIQARLQEEGIQVTRRTIAKYRLALKIPPSHLRKIS